jgi:MFS family permease
MRYELTIGKFQLAANSFYGGISRALSHPGYCLLWWSNGISTTGRWLFKVSLGWLTWELTGSPAWLGIVAFADTFPMVFMTIIAGAWADRIGYLRIMKIGQILLVAGGIITAILALAGLLNIYFIILLSVVVGASEAMTIPARMSFVHSLVPKTDLSAAIALNSATYNFARFLGPAVFGGLIQFVSIPVIISISTGMFSIFYIALFFQQADKRDTVDNKKNQLRKELLEGFRYAYTNSGIFFLLFLLSITAILMRPFIDLVPGISDQIFDMGAEGVAILLSATGLGAMVGGIWLASRGVITGLTKVFTWSILISALTMLLFIVSGNIWFGSVLISIVGMAIVAGSITSQTLIQNTVDPKVRGRVISITAALSWGMPAIGAALMGWMAEFLGLSVALASGAGFTLLLWIWAHNVSVRFESTLENRDVASELKLTPKN